MKGVVGNTGSITPIAPTAKNNQPSVKYRGLIYINLSNTMGGVNPTYFVVVINSNALIFFSMNIDALKNMLETGQDNLILRFGLGQALIKQKQFSEAITHLKKALEFDPEHSAAWKLLGKALVENQQSDEAIAAYEQGIKVAEAKGDIQAAKEMKVFLKRLKSS